MLGALIGVAAPARAQPPTLIPREALVSEPSAMQSMRLSPDGRLISYLAPDAAGVPQLWVRPVDGRPDRKLTSAPAPGVVSYEWLPTSATVCYEWARLIAKVYQADPLVCTRCGRLMSILAFVSDQHSISRILEHLGLRSPELDRPPPVGEIRQITRVAEAGEGWGVPASWD